MNEWRSVVTQGLIFIAFMEFFEVGKWVFTDGWGGVLRFHFRFSRQLLAHCIGLLYGGSIFGILSVFHWRAFRGMPLSILMGLVVLMVVTIPFRRYLTNFFRTNEVNRPVKPNELPFPQ